jgi:hypothetical protein
MKINLKSDSGFALGLVLIFVLGVGAVLGSVMMVTQLSADAQGRGVDQLKSSNSSSVATAEVIKVYTQAASENYALQMAQDAPNCGLPEHVESTSISCQVVPNSDPTIPQVDRVFFQSPNGSTTERDFTITQSAVNGSERVTQSGS